MKSEVKKAIYKKNTEKRVLSFTGDHYLISDYQRSCKFQLRLCGWGYCHQYNLETNSKQCFGKP